MQVYTKDQCLLQKSLVSESSYQVDKMYSYLDKIYLVTADK